MESRYEKLEVWQAARHLVASIYVHLRQFPKEELYALTDQAKRAAVSIPSNIAEGAGRDSDRDFLHFLVIARGSVFEVKTQLQLGADLGYASFPDALQNELESVLKRLNALISTLKRDLSTGH